MGELLIGVSACLPGERVRYDGGHERNAFLLEELGPTSGSFRSGRRSAPDSDFRASPSDSCGGTIASVSRVSGRRSHRCHAALGRQDHKRAA
jgi:hypothetical protein